MPYKVWQDGNHPKQLETNQFIEQKLDCIHRNPVEAEIVDEPELYRYSSTRDYAGVKGLLSVVGIALHTIWKRALARGSQKTKKMLISVVFWVKCFSQAMNH